MEGRTSITNDNNILFMYGSTILIGLILTIAIIRINLPFVYIFPLALLLSRCSQLWKEWSNPRYTEENSKSVLPEAPQ